MRLLETINKSIWSLHLNMKMNLLPPYDLGSFLVESSYQIHVGELIKKVRAHIKATLITTEIKNLGIEVGVTTSKTAFGGLRHWFECPLCKRRIGIIFVHPVSNKVGCRTCLGLKYKKQRYKGMVENV